MSDVQPDIYRLLEEIADLADTEAQTTKSAKRVSTIMTLVGGAQKLARTQQATIEELVLAGSLVEAKLADAETTIERLIAWHMASLGIKSLKGLERNYSERD